MNRLTATLLILLMLIPNLAFAEEAIELRTTTKEYEFETNGVLYSYLSCSSFKNRKQESKKACSKSKISEQLILDKIVSYIESNDIVQKDFSELLGGNINHYRAVTEKEKLEKEILEYKTLIAQSKDDHKKGILNFEDYITIKSSFETDLHKMIKRYSKLESTGEKEFVEKISVEETVLKVESTKDLTKPMLLSFMDRIEISQNSNISIVT
jgi:hypothetical protein